MRAVLIITTLVISATILFLPFLGEAWADADIRFLIFLGLLGLVALVLVKRALPLGSEYEVMPPMEDPRSAIDEEGSMMEQALDGQSYGQLKMYLELKGAFLERIRARRHLDVASWRLLQSDLPRLKVVVGNDQLFLLTLLEDRGTADLDHYAHLGLAFGEGFAERFGTLLGKVEQWT